MRIGILLHAQEATSHHTNTMLWWASRPWQEAGHSIELLYGPPARQTAFDAVINHVDLTVVPTPYQDYLDGLDCVVVNRRLIDTSKRHVSQALIDEDTDWDGPVIVKTDANAGGHRERETAPSTLARRASGLAMRGLLARALRRPLPEASARNLGRTDVLNHKDYPVFADASAVPRAAWRNPNLVVERFIPERDGDRYAMRSLVVLGSHAFSLRRSASAPIVKTQSSREPEPLPNDPVVMDRAAAFGLEYGKVDYVVHDGAPVMFDVNRTPHVGPDPRPSVAAASQALGHGLFSLIGDGGHEPGTDH